MYIDFFKALCFLEFVVLLIALTAWFDGYLTQDQVYDYHSGVGLPFSRHIGMWLDILIIAPCAAYIYANYGASWSRLALAKYLFASLAFGAFMHFVSYAADAKKKPTFMFPSGKLSLSGYAHLLLFVLTFTLLLKFYFDSQPSATEATVISLLLAVHLAASTILPAYSYGIREMLNKEALAIVSVGWIAIALAWARVAHKLYPWHE